MSVLLLPVAIAYGGIIALRNLYYDRVVGASRPAGVPVISIGNVTAGGTGKTPFAIEVVRRLLALGRRPSILTRGYGAAVGATPDEVLEFNEELPNVPVVIDADRVRGAATARRHHKPDCLVLDDGFQHRRLRRDLDIVLIDALNPWGGDRLLPAGRLREPLTSLSRAHVLIITRTNQVERHVVEAIAARLRRVAGNVPILRSTVDPIGVTDLSGRRENPATLSGRHVYAICGVGNPVSFVNLVQRLSGNIRGSAVFNDHHIYTADDVLDIRRRAEAAGAATVVTTRKDWVKLAPLWRAADAAGAALGLERVDMRVALGNDLSRLDERLRAVASSVTEPIQC